MHFGLLRPRRFFDAFVVGRLEKAAAVAVGTAGAGDGDGALSALWLLRAGDDAAIDEQLRHSKASPLLFHSLSWWRNRGRILVTVNCGGAWVQLLRFAAEMFYRIVFDWVKGSSDIKDLVLYQGIIGLFYPYVYLMELYLLRSSLVIYKKINSIVFFT